MVERDSQQSCAAYVFVCVCVCLGLWFSSVDKKKSVVFKTISLLSPKVDELDKQDIQVI